jgi:hypothetical protein
MKKTVKKTAPKKQHTPDYYPVVRETYLGDDVNGAFTGTHAGDAGQILSIVNRRLYRYGKLYQVKLDLDIPSTFAADAVVEVYALRNNWDTQRAFALAKSVFDEAYADELKIGTGNLARWRDFRIANGVSGAGIIDPVNYDSATLAIGVENLGEHALSSVDKAGVETFFTWGNANATTLSVPAEWTSAGRTASDPNIISTSAPYDGVNTDQLSDIEQEHLGDLGNNPPYSATSANDLMTKVATLYFRPGAIGLSKLSTGYFDAPCGLFIVKVNTSLPNGYLKFSAKAGDYKGVHALSMCQE